MEEGERFWEWLGEVRKRIIRLEGQAHKHEEVLAILLRGGDSNEIWTKMAEKWIELTPKEEGHED